MRIPFNPKTCAIFLSLAALLASTSDSAGQSCSYTISPTSRPHGYGAATNTVSVTTSNNCAWTVVNTNDWISILSGASGTGTGTVSYTVAAAVSTATRSGAVNIAGQLFTVNQAGFICAYKIAPTSRMHGYAGATNSVSLTTSNECPWDVSTTNDWISILSPTSGTGSVTLTYAVATNPSVNDRTGALLVGGQLFMLTQSGISCSFSLSPTNRTHGYGAATGSVSVATVDSCPWTVANSNSWITIISSPNGAGGGTVSYAVEANSSLNDRMGVVFIGGQPFTLTQRGITCSLSISPGSRMHGYGAATNSVTVTTGSGCAWAVINTNTWITILSGTNATGSGSVAYTVASNPSSVARMGAVAIDGETFMVTQAGAPCTYTISPTSFTHGIASETGMVNLTTISGCAWSVTNTNTWITITSNTNGMGNGSVAYTVTTNSAGNARTATVIIASEIFTVSQVGSACAYKLSPTNRTHGYGATGGTLSITTSNNCAWAVVNTNSWITIISGSNGTGSGSISYTVEANPTSSTRTGLVMVADQMFTLGQQSATCTYKLSTTNRVHGFAAATNSVTVTAGSACSWTALNTNNWITITAGANGTGNGTINYTVNANLTPVDRIGIVTVADQALTLTQRGATNGFVFDAISLLDGSRVKLRLIGGPGGVWELQASSNMVHWAKISNVTNVTGLLEYIDANPAPLNRRFYRAVLP